MLSVLILLLFLIKKEKINQKIDIINKQRNAFIFETAKVIELRYGKSIWKFDANKAVINRTKDTLQLYGLKGHFLENENNIIEITTPKALLDLRNSNLNMYGGKITTIYGPKKVLTADKITWISKEETLSGTGNVLLKQENMMLKSRSFIADNELKMIKISGEPEISIDE